MTTAEKYRIKEASAVIQVARYIFNFTLKDTKLYLLGDVIDEIKTGKTPSKRERKYYEDNFIDWYKPNEIGATKFCNPSKEKLSKYAFDKGQATIYSPNTLLINAIGDVGRVSILSKEASSNQQITGIKPESNKLNVEYCYYYLLANRHLFYKDLFRTTLPIVNQKKIKSIPIILPSLTHQKHIVGFLNELENLKSTSDLNKEKWGAEYIYIANKFFGLKENTNSILDELTHQLSLVSQLRQAFLREAMQGKLVEQNPTDEPASELLARIKAEKEQLIKEKKTRKQKPLPPIEEAEIPFEIPEGWEWCRLGSLCNIKSGKRIHADDYRKEGIPFLRSGEIGTLGRGEKIKHPLFIGREKYENIKSKFGVPKEGDILIACIGGSIGNTWVVDNREFYFKDGNLVLIESNANIRNDFLLYYLKSPFFWSNTILNATDSSYNALTIVKLNDAEFPLPSLAEQKRIVAKLDELMTYCDQLEESIKDSQAQNEMLLGQVLREALEPERMIYCKS